MVPQPLGVGQPSQVFNPLRSSSLISTGPSACCPEHVVLSTSSFWSVSRSATSSCLSQCSSYSHFDRHILQITEVPIQVVPGGWGGVGGQKEVSDWVIYVFVEPRWRLGEHAKWGDLVTDLGSFQAPPRQLVNRLVQSVSQHGLRAVDCNCMSLWLCNWAMSAWHNVEVWIHSLSPTASLTPHDLNSTSWTWYWFHAKFCCSR